MKTAFVTGITGQDGAYLAEHLVNNGYKVVGGVRRSSAANTWRLEELGLMGKVQLEAYDLLDPHITSAIIRKHQPDEVYNLAAQSFVGTSFDQPAYTLKVDALGVVYLLEAIRTEKPDARFYQASTSEMFGLVQAVPQKEDTPFYPRSPYGVAKLAAHWMTTNYRESYDMYACSGILFNHESPLRGPEFVTRKITIGLAEVLEGREEAVQLGNMDAKRDWGFAGDYIKGMHLMLQQDKADEYVLSTGETYEVREFVTRAAQAIGFDAEWEGSEIDEKLRDKKTGKVIVEVNPQFFRPCEVDLLIGSPAKAEKELGWKRDVSFAQLVQMMAEQDLDRVRAGKPLYNAIG